MLYVELDSYGIIINTNDTHDNPNNIHHIICKKLKGSYILFNFYSLFLKIDI
jgi:hypothetical protein